MPSFFKPIPLGSVVSFRYGSPTAHDRAPMVFVVSFNYNGMMHGLNMRYMNPTTTAQLQWIFQTPEQQTMVVNPFQQQQQQQQQEQQKQAQEQAQQRKQEIMSKQVGVIIKPERGNPFGIKTFGPTQSEVQPAFPGQPGIKVPSLMVPQVQPNIQQQRLINYMNMVNKKKMQLLSDPQRFYYQYIKPLFGTNQHIAQAYRKYNHNFIRNMRIVHLSISLR